MINVLDGKNRKPNDLGFFSGISNDDYHAHDSVSSSRLDTLLECPAKYNNIRKTRKNLDFCSAFHEFFLEPELFEKEYGILKEPNGVTKAAKEEKKTLLEAGFKHLIKEREVMALKMMKKTIMEDSVSGHLFDPNKEHYVEHSGFFMKNGVLCKCRPDYMVIHKGVVYIIDLKATLNCHPKNLSKSIRDWNYHRQAAIYIDGIKEITGINEVISILFFVEKPWEAGSFWTEEQMEKNNLQCLPVGLPDEDLAIGRSEYEEALDNYKKHIQPDHKKKIGYKQMREFMEDKNLFCVNIGLPKYNRTQQPAQGVL